MVNGTTTHTYVTQNGKVVRETIGTGATAKVLDFIYDQSGQPFALKYSTNGGANFETYYYVLNLHGDVVMPVNAAGKTKATYRYNAWGALVYSSGEDNIHEINPFRYRGYYYDTETGFYYLRSRYYDPAICRFINADVLLDQSSFAGTNIFVYCANNPIMCVDPIGYCAEPLGTGIFSFRQRLLGRLNRMLLLEEETETGTEIDPNSPPDHPDYTPPKKGGKCKVKNPNGKGWGWPDKNGAVWVYTPKMHGGEGWTIQYPGGGHSHAYPGGGVRSHFETEQPTITSIIEIFVGGIVTIGLIVDDVTIVGASNDTLITASLAVFFSGISGLSGNRVCPECKKEEYGY